MKAAVFKRFATQFKGRVPVDLSGKKAILGLAELHTAVEHLLRYDMLLTTFVDTRVNDTVVCAGDFLYDERAAVLRAYPLARLVFNPAEWGIVRGVNTPLPRRGETQFDPAGRRFDHDTQPQF
jgi:hypothetical protein